MSIVKIGIMNTLKDLSFNIYEKYFHKYELSELQFKKGKN